ncbi:MAG: PH domain-containing protein [Chloroflexia bacterium]|nr:PH domain-containing protein [Chloroflexia bacterium]
MSSTEATDRARPFGQPSSSTATERRLPEPRERLDPRAITLWRISGLVQALVVTGTVVVPLVVLHFAVDFGWTWVIVPAVAIAAISVALALTLPGVMWRRWRYEIREEEADLQHGVVTITRQLVPMARIQHVDTRRGPIQRHFGLASVVLFTAAGAVEIPALAVDVAATVRDRIATLANVHDDL